MDNNELRMKLAMKKRLIIFLSALLLIVSCGPGKQIVNVNTNQEYDRQYAREILVTMAQLDSICIADTLTQHFRDWYSGAFVDYETNKAMEKRFYIKMYENKRVFYILAPYDDERFKITIRTEEKEN